MNVLKFGFKRLLLSMNLDVRRVGEREQSLYRFAGADPVTFQYLSDLRIAPTVSIELADARAGIIGFSFGPAAVHPIANAFRAARKEIERGAAVCAIRDVLSDFYRAVQPSSALEIVDLSSHEAPGLVGIPINSWVMPWSELSINDTAAHRRICLEEEGLSSGKLVSVSDGATLFGPVSERKLDLETTRVAALAKSIIEKGFQPSATHPIEVIGLRANSEYRWFVVRGQHRLAACAAFDIAKANARIVRIVRREDAAFWPHVVTKTFTLAGALKCFDRLFTGNVCGCATLWSSTVSDEQGCRPESAVPTVSEIPACSNV